MASAAAAHISNTLPDPGQQQQQIRKANTTQPVPQTTRQRNVQPPANADTTVTISAAARSAAETANASAAIENANHAAANAAPKQATPAPEQQTRKTISHTGGTA